jgi:hypothetical protein
MPPKPRSRSVSRTPRATKVDTKYATWALALYGWIRGMQGFFMLVSPNYAAVFWNIDIHKSNKNHLQVLLTFAQCCGLFFLMSACFAYRVAVSGDSSSKMNCALALTAHALIALVDILFFSGDKMMKAGLHMNSYYIIVVFFLAIIGLGGVWGINSSGLKTSGWNAFLEKHNWSSAVVTVLFLFYGTWFVAHTKSGYEAYGVSGIMAIGSSNIAKTTFVWIHGMGHAFLFIGLMAVALVQSNDPAIMYFINLIIKSFCMASIVLFAMCHNQHVFAGHNNFAYLMKMNILVVLMWGFPAMVACEDMVESICKSVFKRSKRD